MAVALIVLVALGLAAWAGRAAVEGWRVRAGALRRLHLLLDPPEGAAGGTPGRDNPLALWLARAGYRRPGAPAWFVTVTATAVVGGLILAQVYDRWLSGPLLATVAEIPGSAGDIVALVLTGGPWILFGLAALAPAMMVRSSRRARVLAIERDLPLALDLLATMAQAGLGFDAALARIVRSQGTDRALSTEFIAFQHDTMAGLTRGQALRQLARRADVPAVTTFTSALIQAEQIGASLAETLQYQAVDLRQRRREQALLEAQALPVKLVFPLVICFLPGVFVSTLAPALLQMVEVGNSVLRSAAP